MAAKNTQAAPVAEPPKAVSEDAEEIVISSDQGVETKKNFIEYVGVATERIITKKDWKAVGIEGDEIKDSIWNLAGGLRLPSEDFNEKQLAYLLKVDGRFRATNK